jgi:hypothetical protein
MTHLSEEQLILHYYGEADSGDHLAACPDCKSAYEGLERLLSTVGSLEAPEPALGFEGRLWRRVEARISPGRWFSWRTLSLAASMAALLVVAFLAGRFSQPPAPTPVVPPEEVAESPQVRERILERSQMVLVELANAPKTRSLDISNEREFAEDLLGSNRLYRQAAVSAGEMGLADVLEDLERLLLEIAPHSPSRVSSSELEDIQRRMEAQGIIFKIRAVETQVRERY